MNTTSSESEQDGEYPPAKYVTLTLQLGLDDAGALITASDGESTWILRPPPAILVARLHHQQEENILRGTIGIADSDIWAPLQSSSALLDVIHAWIENQPKGVSQFNR